MNNEQNKNVENQEAVPQSQAPPTQPTTQSTSAMSHETAEIILDELHTFASAIRALISEREAEVRFLAQENREKLADTLASAPNACK